MSRDEILNVLRSLGPFVAVERNSNAIIAQNGLLSKKVSEVSVRLHDMEKENIQLRQQMTSLSGLVHSMHGGGATSGG
jgi:hypothetical protein